MLPQQPSSPSQQQDIIGEYATPMRGDADAPRRDSGSHRRLLPTPPTLLPAPQQQQQQQQQHNATPQQV
jgi:hypothetical protein